MSTSHIRLLLRYVEILDSKDLDGTGEFVFEFKATLPERGTERVTRIPESGHLAISDHPSMNKLTFDQVLFEGEVRDDETLILEASGTELDRMSADDKLNPYRREFAGPVAGWIGDYTPWDEGTDETPDPEQLGDWRFAFRIEEVTV
jgi:hypothetical protein